MCSVRYNNDALKICGSLMVNSLSNNMLAILHCVISQYIFYMVSIRAEGTIYAAANNT
jgi:hypothetical protein